MTIQQHAERISNWNGYTQAHQTEYDCCMEMGYAVLKEIESVLPCVVKDGIIYDKIRDKIKELRNEL